MVRGSARPFDLPDLAQGRGAQYSADIARKTSIGPAGPVASTGMPPRRTSDGSDVKLEAAVGAQYTRLGQAILQTCGSLRLLAPSCMKHCADVSSALARGASP